MPKKSHLYYLCLFCLILLGNIGAYAQTTPSDFIRISTKNPRYFSTGSGRFWMPVELNYAINIYTPPAAIFADAENVFKAFAASGGNAVRIWGPTPFLEVETKQIGKYDPQAENRVAQIISLAKKYHLRVKFNLESSRSFTSGYFIKKLYGVNEGGPFNSFANFINTNAGRQVYLNRAKAYIMPYRNDPSVYCWELWNEMSAISDGDWLGFTKYMLTAVKQITPKQLVSQTLGSLAYKQTQSQYQSYLALTNNDIFCLHQYLDPGAQLPMCYGPVDEMLSQSMDFMLNNSTEKPVFVNEVGAVEAAHSAMSNYYNIDSAGMLLHDMLFTPFFCGAAGPGSFWLYQPYMNKYNLWYHYERFNRAVKGFDCITEKPKVIKFSNQGVKFYTLKGTSTALIWCRDAANTYITELQQGIAPTLKRNIVISLSSLNGASVYTKASIYNPWTDVWQQARVVNNAVQLPVFTRSVVVKLTR